MSKPVIGLVQGDPAGIGPELMVKLLSEQHVRDRAEIVIIGDASVIERGEQTVGASIKRTHCDSFSRADASGDILHFDLPIEGIADVPLAEVSEAGGKSSLQGLTRAFELSASGDIDGVCFMPFNKTSMHLGGNPFMDEIGFARDYLLRRVNLILPMACGMAGSPRM